MATGNTLSDCKECVSDNLQLNHLLYKLVDRARFELATPGLKVRCSNQAELTVRKLFWSERQELNLQPQASKASALPN